MRHADVSNGPRTILVVADDPVVLVIMREMLVRRHYRVLLAGNSEDAIRLSGIHNLRIDIAVIDTGAGSVDGSELVQTIRAFFPPELRVLSMRSFTEDGIVRLQMPDELNRLDHSKETPRLAEVIRSLHHGGRLLCLTAGASQH